MKSSRWWLAALVALTTACAVEPAAPTEAASRIAFVHDIPGTHPRIPHLEAFARSVDELSAGGLDTEINPGGEVLAGRASLDAALSGKAQIAAVNMAHLEALEPQAGFMNLPFGLNDATMSDAGRRHAVVRTLADRLRPHGVELIGLMRGADQLFAFPRDDVDRLERLAGLRIRVAGGGIYERIMRDLGAEPVAIPIPEIRQAMSAGTVDGVFTSPGGWTSEVKADAPHAVHVPGLMMITYGLVADANWLDSLPASQRAAVLHAGRDVTDGWTQMVADDEAVLAGAQADGATLRVLGPDEARRWRSAVADITDEFLAAHPDLAAELRGQDILTQ